jgi:hypothetical protein
MCHESSEIVARLHELGEVEIGTVEIGAAQKAPAALHDWGVGNSS